MEYIDRAVSVRAGEEIDTGVLAGFLKDSIPGLEGEVSISQFPGGYSNLTYLVKAGKKEMVLRRPPLGADIKSAHDMGREYRILSALRPVFSYCPRPLVYNEDLSVIGSPFYVMERIPGIILRKNFPKGMSISPGEVRSLCENLLDIQVKLHTLDAVKHGFDDLGKPEGYVKRQVEGWSARYRKAKTPDAPDFEVVMSWLSEKMQPDSETPSLIHNDFKFDNVVLNPDNPMEIIGVLDWEMATYGDPMMDFGNTVSYWVERNDPEEVHLMRQMPTHTDGALTRSELIRLYAEKTGRSVSEFDFYYCFGLFRLAVIAQQIYRRYHLGLTRDERFAMLIFGVQILERAALGVIERSSL